jgi:hypothetical protein
MFAIHAPLVVTIDARSTTILNIELAAERSAETWKAHFEALDTHHFVSLGRASDRGLGLVAGDQVAGEMAVWVAAYFHEFHDLFEVLHPWERKASAAINKAYDGARTFAHAKSAAKLPQRLQQYARAQDTGEQAITLYDQRDVWLPWLREAFHGCSPPGKLRTPEGVRSALLSLFDRLEALDSAAIPHALKPVRQHLDALFVPLKQADAIAAELRFVVPNAGRAPQGSLTTPLIPAKR